MQIMKSVLGRQHSVSIVYSEKQYIANSDVTDAFSCDVNGSMNVIKILLKPLHLFTRHSSVHS